MRRPWGRAALAVVLLMAPAFSPAAADVVEANLKMVGRSDLGGGAPYDDVAAVGNTAVVATGGCPGGAVKVVDVRSPHRPTIAATLPIPAATAAVDLDAGTFSTPTFTGNLVAVALAPCGPGMVTVAYYDVSVPENPRALGQGPGCPRCAPDTAWVSLSQWENGRILSLRPAAPGMVSVDEVTDPMRPSSIGQWVAPSPNFAGGCERGRLHSGVLHDGNGALVVFTDGRVFDLNLAEPSHPSDGGATDPPDPVSAGRSTFSAVLPVGSRTLALVAETGPHGGCPGAQGPGLRLIELATESPPREVDPVRFTTEAAPGRVVASGELAYVAWHADGVRVVDLGEVKAKTVGQFVPQGADVVGVALLADHIVVTDRNTGLYVLDRPDEGGGEKSFWSDLVGLLPYLGFAGILAAAFVVPRLALGHAARKSGVPSPGGAPTPRRVA